MEETSYAAQWFWTIRLQMKVENDIPTLQIKPDSLNRLLLPLLLVRQHQVLFTELGHVGQEKMRTATKQWYWWSNQHRSIVNFGNTCELWTSYKLHSVAVKTPLHNIMTGFPEEIVGIDLIRPPRIIESGNRYFIDMVNFFTVWREADHLAEVDVLTMGHAILKYWVHVGVLRFSCIWIKM